VRIVVPYAPGGLTDVVARLYSEQLRQSFGRGVFVENKPGASGIIAIEEMARARPDGHTLMIGNISTNALTPVLLAKKMKIDYERDVQIVTPLADVPVFFLATTTNFPPQTFADFLAYARDHPGKVRYGSAGVGSYQQINTEILAKRAGLDLVHIPFKGGGAEILRDLANGDIQVSWFNITNPVGMMKAGRVRALAVAAAQRLAQHADVPTLAEVGFPGIRAAQWVAAFAPAGVPADIVATLHKAFVAAMSVPEMQEAFARGGMLVPRGSALADPKAWLREEMTSWKRDVEDTGIVVEE
jgi:tripartite-type tricarboxylate transporter receptor subunit TctC